MFVLPKYSGAQGSGVFRNPRDLAELITYCNSHGRIWVRSAHVNDARMAKVNGRVRTWKRDATRIEIPLKYGLYEYFTFTAANLGDVLIPVDVAGPLFMEVEG